MGDYEYKESGGDAAADHNIGSHWTRQKEYRVVSSPSPDTLNEEVSGLLNQDWSLVGGVCYATCNSHQEYVQALIHDDWVRT